MSDQKDKTLKNIKPGMIILDDTAGPIPAKLMNQSRHCQLSLMRPMGLMGYKKKLEMSWASTAQQRSEFEAYNKSVDSYNAMVDAYNAKVGAYK